MRRTPPRASTRDHSGADVAPLAHARPRCVRRIGRAEENGTRVFSLAMVLRVARRVGASPPSAVKATERRVGPRPGPLRRHPPCVAAPWLLSRARRRTSSTPRHPRRVPVGPARRLGCPVAVRRDAAFADAGRARVGADGLPATPLRGRVFAGDPRLADFHHHARARRAPGRDRAAQGRSAPVAGRRSPRSSRDGVDEQRALARRARGRRLGPSAFASRGDCVAHVRARGRGLGRRTQGDGLRRARRRGNERRRDGGTSGDASASARRPRG